MWRVLNDVLDVVVAFVAVSMVLGWVRLAAHRRGPASGDPAVAGLLETAAGRRVRRCAVAVVDLGAEPVRRTAFVDADAETPFEIGSVTKPLTGLLVADAIERGEVSHATTVGDLVPRSGGTELGTVTLGELVTHRSGLPRIPRGPRFLLRVLASNYFGTDPYRGLSARRVLDDAAAQRLTGRGVERYSNLGAAVAGQALAERAGRSYPALLRERILSPLGMTSTSAEADATPARRGYTRWGRRSAAWRLAGYAPAGGVVSTIDDMAALLEALLRGTAPGMSALDPLDETGPGGDERAMFWAIRPARGRGFQSAQERTLRPTTRMGWHNGETGGFSAFLAIYPNGGRGVVALSNVADAKCTQRLAEAVLDAYRVTA